MPARYLINLNNNNHLSCFDNQVISPKDIAMPEKKTSSMLIRDIPMDVWERIDKLCRRKNMKRRDFVEQALRFFEGEETPDYVKKIEPIQQPEIVRIMRDVEGLKREIIKNKIEDRTRPERPSELTIKSTDSVESKKETPLYEEKGKKALTTVFCWGLDDIGGRRR
jgi:hypothetical protein